jgi:phosphomethylpyrimidine synthase
MSKARRDMQWDRQFELGMFSKQARAIRAGRSPQDEATCTMCGSFCAAKNADSLFRDFLSAEKQ